MLTALLTALPGDGGLRARKVALLAAHGVDGASLLAVQAALLEAGAVTVVVAPRQGLIETADGQAVEATASFENSPPVLFDAVLLPDGELGVKSLLRHAQAVDFVDQQFRHGRTLLALGASKALLDHAGVEAFLASGDAHPGVLVARADEAKAAYVAFAAAIGRAPPSGTRSRSKSEPVSDLPTVAAAHTSTTEQAPGRWLNDRGHHGQA